MQPRKSAFTLIELLVVIAIIAILAAILFPVFAQAREKARAITCVSNLKQISLSLAMYNQDYDEMMVSIFEDWHQPATAWDTCDAPSPYEISVAPYVKNKPVYICPSDAVQRAGNNCFMNQEDYNAAQVAGNQIRSYGYVCNINTEQGDAAGTSPDPNTGMSAWSAGYSIASFD